MGCGGRDSWHTVGGGAAYSKPRGKQTDRCCVQTWKVLMKGSCGELLQMALQPWAPYDRQLVVQASGLSLNDVSLSAQVCRGPTAEIVLWCSRLWWESSLHWTWWLPSLSWCPSFMLSAGLRSFSWLCRRPGWKEASARNSPWPTLTRHVVT